MRGAQKERHSRLSEKETARREACKVQDMGDVVTEVLAHLNEIMPVR